MLMYPFGYNKVAIFLRKKNYKIFTHFPLKIFNFINSTLLPHKSTFLWSKCLLYWNSWNTLQMLIAFGLTPFPSRTLSPISHWKFMEQYSLQSTFNAMFYPCSWIANAGSISFELAGVKSGKAGIEFVVCMGVEVWIVELFADFIKAHALQKALVLALFRHHLFSMWKFHFLFYLCLFSEVLSPKSITLLAILLSFKCLCNCLPPRKLSLVPLAIIKDTTQWRHSS